MKETARRKIATERARLQAEATRLRERTRPLLKKATEELGRLQAKLRAALDAKAHAEQEAAELRERVRSLEAARGLEHPHAGGGLPPLSSPPPLQGPPTGPTRKGRTGTKLMACPPPMPELPPIPTRPARPSFLRSTQVIDTGKVAVWQDNAHRVVQVDVAKQRASAAPPTERRALRPEDLESQDLVLDVPDREL